MRLDQEMEGDRDALRAVSWCGSNRRAEGTAAATNLVPIPAAAAG